MIIRSISKLHIEFKKKSHKFETFHTGTVSFIMNMGPFHNETVSFIRKMRPFHIETVQLLKIRYRLTMRPFHLS